MKPTFLVVILAMLCISCAPLANLKPDTNPPLTLGEIGKSSSSIIHNDIHQVGKPSLSQPIVVTAREVQFTKTAYRKYSELNKRKGQESKIEYIDSLPIKPKHISLEISGVVALTSQLNDGRNDAIRSYLAKDEDYNIVIQVSAMTSTAIMNKIFLADGIFLTQDRNNIMGIELVKDNSRESIALSQFEVFDYRLAGFCWGLDRYGNEKIEVIVLDGESCPKGTEGKAYKLDRTKPYLKL
ncbi:hypothetical protein QSE00_23790 [Arenibacter sp. M-2]|uniref:hypothetical protein n=1 Tax=Arenibacter sp. M-2 TaxID=3053612 RepID=UPI00257001CA|nr:hypothetical protein [Arenibacter sp. M-2]MDL5514853.1 hypothetical protein [Arenibacter sp. M-2]